MWFCVFDWVYSSCSPWIHTVSLYLQLQVILCCGCDWSCLQYINGDTVRGKQYVSVVRVITPIGFQSLSLRDVLLLTHSFIHSALTLTNTVSLSAHSFPTIPLWVFMCMISIDPTGGLRNGINILLIRLWYVNQQTKCVNQQTKYVANNNKWNEIMFIALRD